MRYIEGDKNIVADALSRLGLNLSLKSEHNPEVLENPKTRKLAEAFANTRSATAQDATELPATAFPISFKILQQEQQKDQALIQKVGTRDDYSIHTFHGGEKDRLLICKDGKIVVPKPLQARIVDWYHTMLCHPGETRTEETIRQHFAWKGLKYEVQRQCKACHVCQVTKRSHKKYGHLSSKGT